MRLLIPLDQTERSEAILDVVRRTVLPQAGEVHLLAVLDPNKVRAAQGVEWPSKGAESAARSLPTILSPLYGLDREVSKHRSGTGQERVTRDDLVQNAEHYLVDAASGLQPASRCIPAIIESDDPARAIVEYAGKHRIDVIAMATHARTGIDRAVRGSVTDAVIRSGVAPVLVCHAA